MSTIHDAFLDNSLKGWLVKTAKREHWRMASWYELDDLIQDGLLCYCKCREHYKDNKQLFGDGLPTAEQRRWFMSLVQRTFYNYLTTLATRASREVPTVDDALNGSVTVQLEAVHPEGPLVAALAKLPRELVEVMDRLLQDGIDTLPYLRTGRRKGTPRGRVRETTRERYVRLYGISDPREKFAEHLGL